MDEIYKVELCYMRWHLNEMECLECGCIIYVLCDHEPTEEELKDNYMVAEEMERNDCEYIGNIALSSEEEAEEYNAEIINIYE
jgi:hypothetical protein